MPHSQEPVHSQPPKSQGYNGEVFGKKRVVRNRTKELAYIMKAVCLIDARPEAAG